MTLLRSLFLSRRSAEPAALGGFLQRRGAFVAQKTVLDYCRVKAGRQERQLFADPGFQAALRHCRWQVYFAALADVFGLAEAWLRPHAAPRTEALAAGLIRLHDAALAVEPAPAEEATDLAAARVALPGHLARLQLGDPKPANRVALLAEAPLFATLPIHAEQRRGEGIAIRGALRFHIVTTQEEMERGFDPAPLAAALLAGADCGAPGAAPPSPAGGPLR